MRIFKIMFCMALIFSINACDNEQVEIDKKTEAQQQAGDPSVVIYGKIRQVGPRYEDVMKKNGKDVIKTNGKLVSVANNSQPWRQLTARSIEEDLKLRTQGFFAVVESIYEDDFLVGRTAGYTIPNITNISFNQANTAILLNPICYGNPSEMVNAMDVLNNTTYPYWRFKAEGTYEDANTVGEWTPVPGYNSLVKRNYQNVAAVIPGAPWLTSATSKSNATIVTVGGELTFGGKIGLPLVAEGETSVSFSASQGWETSTEFTDTYDYSTPSRVVPANKGIRYTLVERWKPVTTYWRVPVEFKGNLGFRVREWNGQNDIWRNAIRVTNRTTAFSLNDYFENRCMRVKVIERLSHDFYVMPTIID